MSLSPRVADEAARPLAAAAPGYLKRLAATDGAVADTLCPAGGYRHASMASRSGRLSMVRLMLNGTDRSRQVAYSFR